MDSPNSFDFTCLLLEWRKGSKDAGETAIALVYQELRRLAQFYMQQERTDHTLQATALVHEVFVRLFGEANVDIKNRQHFFQLAGRQMRRILIDYGREAHAHKRGGDWVKFSLDDASSLAWERPEEFMALEEAIRQLEQFSPRAAQIVETRFFCGLTEKEAASVLGISVATLKRDWGFAKAFIYRQLTGEEYLSNSIEKVTLKTASCLIVG